MLFVDSAADLKLDPLFDKGITAKMCFSFALKQLNTNGGFTKLISLTKIE